MIQQYLPYWIDVSDPEQEMLNQLANTYNLHHSSVLDCLDPEHYPKIEKIDDTLFIILRFFDHESDSNADELLSMTRKIAFFYKDNLLITSHRGSPPFLLDIKNKWNTGATYKNPPQALMTKIMKACIESYSPLLEKIEIQIQGLEKEMIQRKMNASDLIKLYQFRGKLSIVKRLLWHTQTVFKEWMTVHIAKSNPWIQDLKETTEGFYQYVDEMMEDTQNLLNLHISLSSQKTNEVMRFLTVVSLFFLPLTFIVGIYGMNFKFMPELESSWGYPLVWISMILVSLFIFRQVKKRGWLDNSN
jgi:magnesium transporter